MKRIVVLYHEYVEEANKYLFIFESENRGIEMEVDEEVGTILASCIQEVSDAPPAPPPPPEPPKKSAMELARERARSAVTMDQMVLEPIRPKVTQRPLRAGRKDYANEPEAELLQDIIGDKLVQQGLLVGKVADAGPDGNSLTDAQVLGYVNKITGGTQAEKNHVFTFLVHQADVGTLYRFAKHLPAEVRTQVVERRTQKADENGVPAQDLLPFLYNRVDRLYNQEGKALSYTQGDADPMDFKS